MFTKININIYNEIKKAIEYRGIERKNWKINGRIE
jgi:hypothetical protein